MHCGGVTEEKGECAQTSSKQKVVYQVVSGTRVTYFKSALRKGVKVNNL